jgi:signal transduction histidine kinase
VAAIAEEDEEPLGGQAVRDETRQQRDAPVVLAHQHVAELVRYGDPESARVGQAIAFRDITDRVQMQQQLEQHNKLESIGQLATGIAHELNTPAQFIDGNLRFLHDQFPVLCSLLTAAGTESQPSGSRTTEYLLTEIPKAIDQSLDGIARVSSIVTALREFSHPGAAKRTLANLNKGLESTIAVSRNEWKNVAEVETHLDPELPFISCYASELNQVFLNIMINAVHAIREKMGNESAKKGRIEISTSHTDREVEVRISDSGTGIGSEIRQRVFDPFFTTKEVGRGTGQGLTISHSIVVEKHRGTIQFETQEGSGTIFIIRLPIQPPAREGE